MADSSDSSCYVESDDDSFLSGSVNYSTECSDDYSVSDIFISPEMGVQPYRFEPEAVPQSDSTSESVGHGEETHINDASSPERVGNNHW